MPRDEEPCHHEHVTPPDARDISHTWHHPMMGRGHALSGAAAWIAVTGTAAFTTNLHPLPALSVLAGTLVTAGAALLPDLDHHNGTIAHSAGLLSRGITGAAGNLSGGHRRGLHTALAAAGFTAATVLAGRHLVDLPVLGRVPVGSALILLALVAFATKALELGCGGKVAMWTTGLLVAAFVLAFAQEELLWLPLAVLVGFLTHLVGDLLTTGGLPLLWPLPIKPPRALRKAPVLSKVWLPNGSVALPLLGNAGSARERVLTVALTGYVLAGVFVTAGQLVAGRA